MVDFQNAQIPPPKNWQDFERLCCDLWKAIWGDPTTQLNGRQGQPQHGVDVFGQPDQGLLWSGIQCKGRENYLNSKLSSKELLREVEKAKKFQPRLYAFTIATSGPKDAAIEKQARDITCDHERQGLFSVHVWGWDDIQSELASYPNLVSKYYPNWHSGLVRPAYVLKRITTACDTDFTGGFRDLYLSRINQAGQNPFDDLVRWQEEYEEEARDGHEHTWVGYVFVLKRGSRVVAFLHADGHKPSRYLLINWLAVSRGGPAGEFLNELLTRSAQAFRQEGIQWQAIIYEFLENEGNMAARLRLAGSQWDRGLDRRWGRELTPEGQRTRSHQLPVEYVQPELDFNQIGKRPEESGKLLYIPLAPVRPVASKSEVADILRIVYMEWYQSTFDSDYSENQQQSEEYARYLSMLFDQIMATCQSNSEPPCDEPRSREGKRGRTKISTQDKY